MNVVVMMMKKFYGSILLTSLLLTGLLVIAQKEALADYQPPPRQENQKENQEEKFTIGTVSRGCPVKNTGATQSSRVGLVALAPQVHHIGKTTSTHPTFAWYIPEVKSYQVGLELYQKPAEGKVKSVWTWESTTKPGIMTASLPKTQPPLEVGQKYYWQVKVKCKPNHPSSWLVTGADLEVVATSANLNEQLTQAQDLSTKADLYADAGIWYDALAIALDNSNSDRIDLLLLENLAEIEAQEKGTNNSQDKKGQVKTFSYKLQQIIEAEQ